MNRGNYFEGNFSCYSDHLVLWAQRMPFSDKQKKFVIKWYEHYGPRRCAQELAKAFSLPEVPHPQLVSQVFKHFEEHGTIHRVARKTSAYKIKTPERKKVLSLVAKSKGQVSTRDISENLPVSRETARKILHDDGQYPYRERNCQDISENNKPKRVEFCQDVKKNNCRVLNKIARGDFWIVDETDISLVKPRNSQNNRTWSKALPTDGRNLNPQKRGKKVSVFIAVSKWGIIHKFYSGTLDGPKYYSLLRYHIIPKIRKLTPKSSHSTMGFL